MTTTELLAIFRAEVDDLEATYLWSDALVYGYIDDAQKQFCRETYGIEDARSFRLAIKPTVEWYTIEPRILKVRSAIDPATGYDIPLVAYEKMRVHGLSFDGAFGAPVALITGMEKNKLRVTPIPTASPTRGSRANSTAYAVNDTVTLTADDSRLHLYKCTTLGTSAATQSTNYNGASGEVVTDGTAVFTEQTPYVAATSYIELHTFRLPSEVVSGDDFEIDEQHHRNLLLWVKHRAYDVQDSEVYDKQKSATFKARFEAYCAKVLVEQSRLNHSAGVVAYGGI